MRPLDPRLLRYAAGARWFLAGGAVLGAATTGCIVAFAWLLTSVITGAIAGDGLPAVAPMIAALAGVALLRAVLVYAQEVLAARGAARVKSELRLAVLDAVARRGPAWLNRHSDARVATLLGRGMDSLDDYFARYLPQLLLTVLATPVIVGVILLQDVVSALFIIVTLPLIPIFMVLIGWATQAVQRRQWTVLGDLSASFADMLGGLATLKIFGRQHRQVERMRQITQEYRVETMRVLRVSFLSGFVLELAASLSVALVAVSVGLRLVDGSMDLGVGLFVLLLAPEAFLPIRQVGANFHAAAEGVAAAEDAFAILDDDRATAPAAVPAAVASDPGPRPALELRAVAVDYGTGPVAEPVSARFEPGSLNVIIGPSGSGKSSLLAAVAGFVPFSGTVSIAGHAAGPDPAARSWLAWSGQRPSLIRGTIAENVALGSARADPALVLEALNRAAASELDPDAVVGLSGEGLSGGQAQRVAIARAVYRTLERGCHVLMLDEPTSALDHDTELRLIDGLRAIADTGVVVVVVSHRRALLSAAEHLVTVRSPELVGAP